MFSLIESATKEGREEEFLDWRVRIITSNNIVVEGTIKALHGPTVSLSDVIISYTTGHYRYLSFLDIEKEEISNLSVIASSTPSPHSSSSSINIAPIVPPIQKQETCNNSNENAIKATKVEEPIIANIETKELPTNIDRSPNSGPIVLSNNKKENSTKNFTTNSSTKENTIDNSKKDEPLIEIVYSGSNRGHQKNNKGKELMEKIKAEELDIQANLQKFDKKQIVKNNKTNVKSINPLELFKKQEANSNEKKEYLLKEEEIVEYDPISIIKNSSKNYQISLSEMSELGGRELASIILSSGFTNNSTVLFLFSLKAENFYTDCTFSCIKHLLNRNIKVGYFCENGTTAFLSPSNSKLDFYSSNLGLIRFDSLSNLQQNNVSLIIDCSMKNNHFIDSSLNSCKSKKEKKISIFCIGSKSFFPPSFIDSYIFFGLVEDFNNNINSNNGGNTGILIDIGLIKQVYKEIGIKYPFINNSFSLNINL